MTANVRKLMPLLALDHLDKTHVIHDEVPYYSSLLKCTNSTF